MVQKQKKIRILSQREAKHLLQAVDNQRDKIMIKTALNHGLRNSETLNLKKEDFNFENQTVWVIEGKRGKDRQLPIHSSMIEDLKGYMESKEDTDYLFPSPVTSSHLSTRYFQTMIRDASIQAGLYPDTVKQPRDVTLQIPYRERVTPHTLRHTFSVRLLRNNTPLQEVSKLLGHENVDITIDSYDFLDIETGRSHMNEVSFV